MQKELAMHLIDNFMPVIAYVVMFRSAAAQKRPQYEQVKGDIRRLVGQSEELCRNAGVDSEDFNQARFMVCAWVDEALLSSDWSQKQLWQHEQLQRFYYNTTDAGVEAFDRLGSLGPRQRDVREVYYLCLALGFKGRYIRQGDEFLLEQLKTSNLKILQGNVPDLPSLQTLELFPEAAADAPGMDGAAMAASFVIEPLTALALAAPVLLFGLLYLIYRFVLNGVAVPIS